MLKIYRYNGELYQFDEKRAPIGAVPFEADKPKSEKKEQKAKAVTKKNKARKAETK